MVSGASKIPFKLPFSLLLLLFGKVNPPTLKEKNPTRFEINNYFGQLSHLVAFVAWVPPSSLSTDQMRLEEETEEHFIWNTEHTQRERERGREREIERG